VSETGVGVPWHGLRFSGSYLFERGDIYGRNPNLFDYEIAMRTEYYRDDG